MIIVGCIFSVALSDVIIARLFESDNNAAYARIPLMELAFRIIKANPILGVGANNFTVVMYDYISAELAGMWLYIVHNKYLLVWAETGIIGIIVFLWFLFSTIGRGWQCWRTQHPIIAPISLAMTVAIIGHMIHMNVDVFQGRPHIQLLWIMSGLLIATLNMMRKSSATDLNITG